MNSIYADVHGGEPSPPLVLIHGSGGTRLHWPPEVRRMPGAKVYALDLPGHGKSSGPAAASIDDYVEAVLGWMELNLDRPALVAGHSLGGAITLALARQDPGKLAGIALVGSGARLRVHPTILSGSENSATYPAVVDQIMDWAFGPQAAPRLVHLARRRMLEVPPAVLNADFRACDAFDVMDQLELIKLPALIVCGSEDRLTPLKYSEFLATRLPAAALEVVPGAGHMVMLEQPAVVAAALAAFLARVSP
jgi:pimeloyl-ACP methyl ester carboxylesterase